MTFKASLYDINKAIEVKDLKERPLGKIIPEQYMNSSHYVARY